ncbi:VanW family protein [Trueperella pyogenes]
MADNQEDNLRQAWHKRLGDTPAESDSADVDIDTPETQTIQAPEPTPDETQEYAAQLDTMEPKKRRVWPWATAAFLALGAAYVGAAYAYQDKIPANTSISGIDVSGMDAAEAKDAVASGLHEALTAPRQVSVNGSTQEDSINPGNISLAVDYEKTFAGLSGFSLDPRRLWAHISGAANVDAVLTADDAALSAEIARLADVFKQDAKDAELTLNGGVAQVKDSQNGRSVEVAKAPDAVLTGWLANGPIMLPTSAVEPALSTQAMKEFVDKSVDPLLKAPISITIKDIMVELKPEQTASIVGVKNDGGKPSLSVDEEKLTAVVNERAGEVLSAPKNATIAIVNGAPAITPSQQGESIDIGQVASALLALPQGSGRTIAAEVKVQEPELTTEAAEKLGIKEVISEISTPLTNDSVRTTNLVVGTRKVTNTLIKPGERFNLEKALGPIDEAHGFVSSGVVSNGFNSTALGGGLSQLSTNTFNVGYRAGMVDVAHQPHSKYFKRYPMGLEATLWSGQISMIWENNTPYGVLLEAWVANGRVHTRLWSTHHWDVEVWQGEPFNYVQPETRTNKAADCEPSGAGGPGFSVTVGRVVKLAGQVHEKSQYTWTYQPVHAVRCE